MIYAVCVIAFQQLISKACRLLASVLQAASFVATALAHQSRALVATNLPTADASLRQDILSRAGEG